MRYIELHSAGILLGYELRFSAGQVLETDLGSELQGTRQGSSEVWSGTGGSESGLSRSEIDRHARSQRKTKHWPRNLLSPVRQAALSRRRRV